MKKIPNQGMIDMDTELTNSANDEQLFSPLLKKIELVLVILSAGSLVLKLLHASFANTLMIISLSSLSFFYMAWGMYLGGGKLLFFRNHSLDISLIRKIATYNSGFAMSLICIGVVFKFQFWEGGKSLMLIGVMSAAFSVLMTLFLFGKTGLSIYRQLLTRVTIFFAIGVLLFLTPDAKLLDIIHPGDDPEKAVFKKYLEHPEDPEVRKEWHQMQDKMDSIRNLK